MNIQREPLWQLMGVLFKAHPWHGVPIGDDPPERVTTYIEIVPSDTVKYELDKFSGHLKVDRPQAFSNVCPTLYGFIPQTYCMERVAAYCREKTGRTDVVGDNDPLDICVLSEKVFPRGDILLQSIPIGGFRMIDGGEADDKVIAVLKGDATYGGLADVGQVPPGLIDRLKHYFLTYKNAPDARVPVCEITHVYGREEAYEVIRRARADYLEHFSGLEGMLKAARIDQGSDS